MNKPESRFALRIALLYVLLTGLLDVISDQVLATLNLEPHRYFQITVAKDSAFVLLTALLLFGLVHHEIKRLKQAETERRASDVRLLNVLDVDPDAIMAMDARRRIVLFNKSAGRIFGYSTDEVMGQSLDLLLPGQLLEEHLPVSDIASIPDSVRLVAERLRVSGRRKDGTEFPAEVTISVSAQDGQVTFTFNVRDITRRTQAREALRESEERYHSMIIAMQEGVIFQDANGVILTCNASAERMLRLSADQIIGKTLLDPSWQTIHADGSPFPGDTHPAVLTLRTGQPLSNVVMGIHKPDGVLTWLSINSQPLFHAGASSPYGVVVTLADITDRRQAEQALRESEARYRSLVDSSIDGIFLSAPDGRILAANAAACQILGRTEEEICQLGRAGIMDTSDARLAAALEERERTSRFRRELFLLRKDGTRVPCEVSSGTFKGEGGELRTSLIIRDITERKWAEEAMSQLAAVVESSDDAIVGATLEGLVVSWNAGARRLYGYSAAEMIGHSVSVLLPPERRDDLTQISERLKRGENIRHFETTRRAKDGRNVDVSLTISAIRNAAGQMVGTSTIARDITERVHAYQLLERRVEERTRELTTLLDVSRTVASTLELKPLLRLIIEQLKPVVNYASAAIFTLEDKELVIVEYEAPILQRPLQPLRLPLEQAGLAQDVIQCREPVILDDVRGDILLARALQNWTESDVELSFSYAHSWMGIPLMVKDKVIGMLDLTHSEPNHYTSQHARLAQTIANQAAIAIENAKLYEQAQEVAALQERQRLARELHDAVTQTLFSASLIAEVLPRLWESNQIEGREYLEDLRRLTRGALAEMRAMLLELRPSALNESDLGELLRQLADAIAGRARLPVTVDIRSQRPLPSDVKVALYRVAQEALNNVAKHSKASRVTMSLTDAVCTDQGPSEAGAELCIMDDGKGFDLTRASPEHFGLAIMRERAQAIGATLDIETRPGQGTKIAVVWLGTGTDAPAQE